VGSRVGLGLLALSALAGPARAGRIIYLVHDGARFEPGEDDARAGTSSLVGHAVSIPAWTTTPEIWHDTVACVAEIYAPFAVTVTDVDPGDVPHLEGIFGGSPLTLGFARGVAGMSPFTADCAIIEDSVVFAFTDILAGDARSACQVMAQELGHSYGLDHELLATDPMSYENGPGDRAFVDAEVSCGEYTPRPCGFGGYTCRAHQNSYALLAERLGLAGADQDSPDGGCATTGGAGWGAMLLAMLAARSLRRAPPRLPLRTSQLRSTTRGSSRRRATRALRRCHRSPTQLR